MYPEEREEVPGGEGLVLVEALQQDPAHPERTGNRGPAQEQRGKPA